MTALHAVEIALTAGAGALAGVLSRRPRRRPTPGPRPWRWTEPARPPARHRARLYDQDQEDT